MAIDSLALCLLGFFTLYLVALSCLALMARTRQEFTTNHARRFACVIPAHNEESSIYNTVASLKNVHYPQADYDVIVIADNCSDRTAEIARSLGSNVFERKNSAQRGKGYALRWCFDRLLTEQHSYDAIVVIDADTIVDPEYLTVMNYYLEHGSMALQCSDMAASQPGSWISEMTRLGFTLYNYVRPLGRKTLNCSAGVRGNGMCFAVETLRTVPWNTFSLNEDLEYGLVLLLNGINVDFAPEAKVYATMPTSPRNAESQRSRWEGGRFPIIQMYGPRLLKETFRSSSLRCLDAFIDLITPPFVSLFGALLLFFVTHAIVVGLGSSATMPFFLAWGVLVVSGLAHVFIGLLAARADVQLYKAFFYLPRYAFWKLALYTKSLRRAPTIEWVRTTRDQPSEKEIPRGS